MAQVLVDKINLISRFPDTSEMRRNLSADRKQPKKIMNIVCIQQNSSELRSGITPR